MGTALLARASGALVWSLFNALAARLGTVVIGVALARILGPQQFGTYAVALLALMAALSFNELGVSLAIVRWVGSPERIAPTVATMSVAGSVSIAVTGVLLSPTLARVLGDESATPVLRVLFLTVIISGLVATPAALLQREFRQRARTLIDQVAIWIGALVSIGLAVAGYGAMGLAVGRLLGVTASCFLMYRAAPNGFRFGWSPPEVPRLLRFGLPLAGVSVVVFAVGFVDQIVTSQTIGAVGLGLYVLATNLASWPITVISTPLRSVAPALFARLQQDGALMGRTFTSVAGLLAAVTLPMSLGLAGASKPLILLVYGQPWARAAEPLLWLGIAVGIRPFFELAYDYLVIAGGTQRLFGLQIAWVATLVPALLLGSTWGLAGIAASTAVVSLGIVTPLHLLLLRRRGVDLAALATQLLVPGSIACIFGLVAWWISAVSDSAWAAIGATTVLGICVVACLLWTRRRDVRQLRALHALKPVTDP